MTSSTTSRSAGDVVRTLLSPRGAVYLLLIALLIAITALNPSFAEPGQLVRFMQRVAPIAIASIGQYFVIVSGEFDLSMGSLVTTQVVLAGTLIGQDASRSVPVLLLLVGIGVAVGLINGLVTTLLKVPSFIVTLGMMLALLGAVMWWTGGAATGNPADSFRQIGRGGIRDVPVLEFLPWAVVILVVITAGAVYLSQRPFGRMLVAIGDNPEVARYAGGHPWRTKTIAFVLSSLSATVAGVLLVGYAGVHPSVGRGYEFIAITAVVLGGVVLGGGRGTVWGALAGAFALEALFMLLNFTSVPSTLRDAIQGVIIIAAVGYAGVALSGRTRRGTTRPHTPGQTGEPVAGHLPSSDSAGTGPAQSSHEK